MEINENSLIITVPLYEEKEIINKNIYNISYCEENMQKKNQNMQFIYITMKLLNMIRK